MNRALRNGDVFRSLKELGELHHVVTVTSTGANMVAEEEHETKKFDKETSMAECSTGSAVSRAANSSLRAG